VKCAKNQPGPSFQTGADLWDTISGAKELLLAYQNCESIITAAFMLENLFV